MIHVLIIVYIYGIMVVILCVVMNTWKIPLVVDISMVKNWSEVYWIVRRVKYTLFYWLIKKHWILSYFGIWDWGVVVVIFKGMETLECKIFWGLDCDVLNIIWLKYTIFDNKTTPHLNIIMTIKKLLYFPEPLYYLFGEKLVLCNMGIT